MDGKEIREKIKANNAIIEAINPSVFVLNEKVNAALKDNEKLRAMCPHEFDETGFCIYCDMERI